MQRKASRGIPWSGEEQGQVSCISTHDEAMIAEGESLMGRGSGGAAVAGEMEVKGWMSRMRLNCSALSMLQLAWLPG